MGRAVYASSTKRVVVHDEAIGIVGIAMAGERTGMWGVGIGKLRRGAPRIATVGDARDHTEQARLWEEMAPVLATAGPEPQIVVPNRHSLRLIAESASRFLRSDRRSVREAAEVVWWCCTRREVAGSHAAVVLTDVLSEHFAISHDGGETDDLRIWLGWLKATGLSDLASCLETELAKPEGPKTSITFDEELYKKVARAYRDVEAHKSDASRIADAVVQASVTRAADRQFKNRGAPIKAAVNPLVRTSWERLITVVQLMTRDPRSLLKDIEHFCTADRKSWEREIARREKGYKVSRRDSPIGAVVALAEATVANDLWQAALCAGDEIARQEALVSGDAVRGVVDAADPEGATVRVGGGPVRIRPGDSLALDVDGDLIDVSVVDVSDDVDGAAVRIEWDGMYPAGGKQVILWPARPDYQRRYLGWLWGRFADGHWALGKEGLEAVTPSAAEPEELLAKVTSVRSLLRATARQ